MMKTVFLSLVQEKGASTSLATNMWTAVEEAYTASSRFYHNLPHLDHLYHELLPLQSKIEDWTTLLFSLVYHDVVYNVEEDVVLHNNEESSAAFAEQQLELIYYPAEEIKKCREQILATGRHSEWHDSDTNYLTDADLSILGQPWHQYEQYKNAIRLEYSLYPDSIYSAGRRKVLMAFLQKEKLFKTNHFKDLY